MIVAKIAIRLPDAMLTEIDRLAHEQRMARSELIRKGVEALLEIERRQQTLARARELYSEISAEEQALAEAFGPLIAESLLVYRIDSDTGEP